MAAVVPVPLKIPVSSVLVVDVPLACKTSQLKSPVYVSSVNVTSMAPSVPKHTTSESLFTSISNVFGFSTIWVLVISQPVVTFLIPMVYVPIARFTKVLSPV